MSAACAAQAVAITATPGWQHSLKKGVQPGSFVDVLTRSVDKQGRPFDDMTIANQAFVMILAGAWRAGPSLAAAPLRLLNVCPFLLQATKPRYGRRLLQHAYIVHSCG